MTARRPRKRHIQQELRFAPRGGKRKGAGRKPNVPDAPGVTHRPRPRLNGKQPVHITLRVRRDVPNLRRTSFLRPLTDALRAGNDRFGFRLCHYVIMGNHLHLIVEAEDARALARGVQGLCIRLARRVNRVASRRGRCFADRYHAHVLRSPTEVHRALSYVLLNQRKHSGTEREAGTGVDAFSSSAWFHGWDLPPRHRHVETPVVAPSVWLLREGWRRIGPIAPP